MLLVFLLCSLDCFSQTILTGNVTNSKGEPLQGVTVRLKTNAKASTVSDANGKFSMNLPGTKSILVFSSVGYKLVEVIVTNQKTISVSLDSVTSLLDDVVVIGYGTTTRKDLTGAIGTANIEDMQKAPVRSFEEALAGRVAGVQVVSQDGKPGSPINILIRGLGSLTQESSPLYVIDGFPLENPNNNIIDPNDIESLTILKDASATAIYGARGSNGVVVITTKRGQKGAPKVSYAGSYGANIVTKLIPLLSPYEFIKLQAELSIGGFYPYFANGKTLEDYRNVKGTDWQAKLLRPGPQQNHSIAVSGGNERATYSLSGNYLSQEGVMVNSDYERYQAKLTLDQRINTKVRIGATATYTRTKVTGRNPTSNGNTAIFYSVFSYRPVEVPGTLDNGVDFEDLLYDPANVVTDFRVNPFLSMENELRNTTADNHILNAYGEYNILKNLKLRVTGGLNSTLTRGDVFDGSLTRKGGPNSTSGFGISGSVTYTKVENFLNENTLTYSTIINKAHRISVLAGFTYQKTTLSQYGISGSHLPDESIGLSGIESGTLEPSPAQLSASSLASGLFSFNYNYKGKYFFTGNFRADGSSKFRPENRWSYFPSGAIKWKLSAEPFFKKLTFLSDANIRASYGVTGNNRVRDFETYAAIGFNNPLTLEGRLQPNSAIVGSLANAALKWETAATTDLGFDVGFFNNRFNITVDYYKKVTSDLLYNTNLPGSTGYSRVTKNIGKISNRGLEFSFTSRNIERNNFTWNTSFNITFNQNRLEALSNPAEEATLTNVAWEAAFSTIPAYIAKVGHPLGEMYGLISEGLYQYSDFDKQPNGTYVLKGNIPSNDLTSLRANVQPGDPKYRDLNNDGQITAEDRTIIGRGYPVHFGGLNNNFRYKQFDCTIFLQWSYGSEVINANRIWFESGYGIQQRGAGQNAFAAVANRWSADNINTDVPRYRAGGTGVYSDRYVEDGSFIRLKTINIGYTIPPRLLSRIKIKSCRVYLATSNIYTLTKYKGFDPEVSTYQTGLTPGLDWSAFPRPFNITAGVNIIL